MLNQSSGRLLAATLSAFLCLPAVPQAATAADPWAKVPAAPTACYSGQDQYFEQNDAALAAVNVDHEKQKEINTAISESFNQAMSENPMAMAQAMQQAMMSDPQGAQKYMERMMAQGTAAQTEIPASLEKEKQIENEGKSVIKQYQAALKTAHGPGDARWTALKKKYGLPDDANGPGESGVPDWVWVEWGAILREWDRGYQANCATWWSPTGPIQSYLKHYKTFLVGERIPYEKKNLDDIVLEQYRMLSVPTTGYRTVADYDAVEDYLRMARSLFGERANAPRCQQATDCQ